MLKRTKKLSPIYDQCPDPNRQRLTSLSRITVPFKCILKSASFPNSYLWPIYWLGTRQWCHWTLIWELEKGHRCENWTFENLKKDRSEVQMSDVRNRTWIWWLDVDKRLDVDLSLTYIFNTVGSNLTYTKLSKIWMKDDEHVYFLLKSQISWWSYNL